MRESLAQVDLGGAHLLRVMGYRFLFFGMEGREPPHIHVAHAGRYAKFWLDPVLVAEVRGFRANETTDAVLLGEMVWLL